MTVRMDRRAALLVSLLLAGTAQAQIYKWVDEKGKTHYSNSRDDANRAKAEEMKIRSAGPRVTTAPPAPSPPPAPRYELPTEPTGAGRSGPPPAVSDGREDGSDASRCALARDILNGSLRHGNGKPIDKYDIDVARNDVKMFCR